MGRLKDVRDSLRAKAPDLVDFVTEELAKELIVSTRRPSSTVKDLADPIWKIVPLSQVEISVLDTPLMQRLRHIRQLGMTYLVYPSALHTRFEHSIGAMAGASRMFDALSAKIPEDHGKSLRKILRLAALLHDCGHGAFSHVSERALQRIVGSQFATIREALYQAFPDPMPAAAGAAAKRQPVFKEGKKVPIAELLSVLFVLSPTMEALLDRGLNGISKPDEFEDSALEYAILTMAGLIIGRPLKPVYGKQYHHYFENLISGDIDADKLDYVARDAYFAGIRVAADVDRLLSQVVPAKLSKQTKFPTEKPEFTSEVDEYHLLGLRSAGISALEMFVMTRAHLYERVYGHQKVRAAERVLERLLALEIEPYDFQNAIRLFVNEFGDDFCLFSIWQRTKTEKSPTSFLVEGLCEQIVRRQLPERCVGLSLTRLNTPTDNYFLRQNQWRLLDEYLKDPLNIIEFEKEIATLCGGVLPGVHVIVDWTQTNPIEEDPEIWVPDSADGGSISKVNVHFDMHQLSNAYDTAKKIGWVFGPREHRLRIAAATQIVLYTKFKIFLDDEAYKLAKLKSEDVISTLRGMADPAIYTSIGAVGAHDPIHVEKSAVLSRLPAGWDTDKRNAAAQEIAGKISKSALKLVHLPDLTCALDIFELLLDHANARYGELPIFVGENPEEQFVKNFRDYLESRMRDNPRYQFFSEVKERDGRVDLLIHSRNWEKKVIIEFKAQEKGFDTLVKSCAGQSLAYARAEYASVTFLYAQFWESGTRAQSRAIDVVENKLEEDSPALTICVGVQGKKNTPHKQGKEHKKI